jgi:lysozyme
MAKWQWCLVDDNNVLLTGWQKVGDFWYYLKSNGAMATGWLQDDSRWYFLNENGQMLTGWYQDENSTKWYYLYETTDSTKAQYKGAMAANCTLTIDNKSYSFNSDGSMEDGSLVSDAGIDFIKSWEGFYSEPYVDCVGVLTLGYGMTGDEIKGLSSVTEPQASEMLKTLINTQYANVIKSDLDDKGVTLTQNEFDSFASFSYNCGTGALLGSTLYRNVVAGVRDPDTITANFQAWSNGGGQRIEGLYRRRTKEASMFLYADYTGNV